MPGLALLIWIVMVMYPSGTRGFADSASVEPSASILEANKLLEEELKLAARPQIYLVLDLASSALMIKSRGAELKRLHIHAWKSHGKRPVNGSYRLRVRPSVIRPKAAPVDEKSAVAIDLEQMPDRYELLFDPHLVITIRPSEEPIWPHMQNAVQEWWDRVRHLFRIGVTEHTTANVTLNVTLEQEGARSLAWTVTDGMSLLVGPTALR